MERPRPGGGAASARPRAVRRAFALLLPIALGATASCERPGGAATPSARSQAAVDAAPAEPPIRVPPLPERPDRPESWVAHYRALAQVGPGFVVWESRRAGHWRIWLRSLDGAPARQLSPEEPGRDHVAAHISPDGRHVAYLSLPAPHDDFERLPPEVEVPLHLLRVEDGHDRVIAPNARTYYQSRAVVWTGPRSLVYIAGDATTRALDVLSGEERVLISEPRTKHGMLVNATHSHATNGRPTFSLYFEEDHAVAPRKALSGCQPYFTLDGRYGYWVADNGGPFRKLDLTDGTTTVMLERDSGLLPRGRGYLYYPMLSADQRLLAFGASRNEHGHFDADYDIFVAPVDPDTLKVSGTAVRYTFEPGQDRFPDVFLSGMELGRHRGEAPFELTLDPEPGDGAGAEGWRFDWGDGSAGGSAATHRYERPGTYRVSARRGERELGGAVHVGPGAPPRTLRAEVQAGGREVAVVFDELVDVAAASARLESGAAVTGVTRGQRGRDVVVTLAAPLAGADVLVLEGVTDRASVPHRMESARLPLEITSWPGRGDGLAFVFQTDGAPNSARDVDTGRERSFNVTAHGRARLDAHGALRVTGGWFEADDVPAGLAGVLREADAVTIEATAWPLQKNTPDPARIVAFGVPGKSANFSLSQHGRHAAIRLRTDAADGTPPEVDFGELEPGKPNHLLVSYRPGRLVAYQNGVRVLDTDAIQGNLDAWRDGATLAIGADPDGRYGFAGTVEGVALHARALEPDESAARAHAYLELVAERPPIKPFRLKGQLAAASALPTPAQIAPYREALVLYEYRVQRKKREKLGGELVRVAHWAILDGQVQPVPEPGKKVTLAIEPWERHPRLESAYLSDTLDPADVPIYVDVSQ
ncbi:MAG TPA: LamG-like jellyroll fold domain-containing protein [Myxococcota bacterium]|nr:LamG-like jellyroll fold domain-containing protein [Myxococcota bacterium]